MVRKFDSTKDSSSRGVVFLKKHSLSSSEWAFLSLFLLFKVTLFFIAKVNTARAADTLAQYAESQPEFLVEINGAVKKPGEYLVSEGTTLGAVLRRAGLSPFADLHLFSLDKILFERVQITVPFLSEVRVHLSGAVENCSEQSFPIGTRICDIKSKIALKEEADLTFFKSRKKLKNGDEIEVPKKTVEGN